MHLSLHTMVLNQFEEVKAVEGTYDTLRSEHNLHELSAIHALGNVLISHVLDLQKAEQQHDPEEHEKLLEDLRTHGTEIFET